MGALCVEWRPARQAGRHDRIASDAFLRRKRNGPRNQRREHQNRNCLQSRHGRGGGGEGAKPHVLAIQRMIAADWDPRVARHRRARHIHTGHAVRHLMGRRAHSGRSVPGAQNEPTGPGHESRRHQGARKERDNEQCCQPRSSRPPDCDLISHMVRLAHNRSENYGDFPIKPAAMDSLLPLRIRTLLSIGRGSN